MRSFFAMIFLPKETKNEFYTYTAHSSKGTDKEAHLLNHVRYNFKNARNFSGILLCFLNELIFQNL